VGSLRQWTRRFGAISCRSSLAGSRRCGPIEIVPLSDEALTDVLKAAGVPEPFARLLVSVDASTRAGHSAMESDILETLSGRKPLPLKDFLKANKAAFGADCPKKGASVLLCL